MRDDVQYYRDLYNLQRVEALKGPNAMIFGRGGAGGVVNRVSRQAEFSPSREFTIQGGMFANRRVTAGVNQPVNDKIALRLDAMFETRTAYATSAHSSEEASRQLRRFGRAPRRRSRFATST